jgi:hypothetical protein
MLALQTKESFVKAFPTHWEEISLTTVDGVAISAGAWTHPHAGESGRWVLFACPNGQQWESLLFTLAQEGKPGLQPSANPQIYLRYVHLFIGPRPRMWQRASWVRTSWSSTTEASVRVAAARARLGSWSWIARRR